MQDENQSIVSLKDSQTSRKATASKDKVIAVACHFTLLYGTELNCHCQSYRQENWKLLISSLNESRVKIRVKRRSEKKTRLWKLELIIEKTEVAETLFCIFLFECCRSQV